MTYSVLPPVTQSDITQHPEKLRQTPRGGWAWRCGLCGQYASSLTLKGELRCYQHGGTRKRQRSLEAHAEARQAGLKPPRPPGRPIEHGFYSRSERVNLQKLVADYRERTLNVDDTDEDIRHLRARIQNNLQLEPEVAEVEAALDTLLQGLQGFTALPVEGENLTVDRVLEVMGQMSVLMRDIRTASTLLGQLQAFQREIKTDHERIVKLVKARADTRKADAAAKQVELFSLLLGNLMVVLSEMLPPDIHRALQVRIKHDFETLPRRALEPGTIKT